MIFNRAYLTRIRFNSTLLCDTGSSRVCTRQRSPQPRGAEAKNITVGFVFRFHRFLITRTRAWWDSEVKKHPQASHGVFRARTRYISEASLPPKGSISQLHRIRLGTVDANQRLLLKWIKFTEIVVGIAVAHRNCALFGLKQRIVNIILLNLIMMLKRHLPSIPVITAQCPRTLRLARHCALVAHIHIAFGSILSPRGS